MTREQAKLLEELKILRSEYPEVTYLGRGKREKNGIFTDEDRVIVGVDHKRKISPSSTRKALPLEIMGEKIDVQEIRDYPTASTSPVTPMIVDAGAGGTWIGGSIGPVLYHKTQGLVALTNRHVAMHGSDREWSLDDMNGSGLIPSACKPYAIADKELDAAIMKILKPDLFTVPENTITDVAEPTVGIKVYYRGGKDQKIKSGIIMSNGWGTIQDKTQEDGVYYTLNFRFINISGGVASPISGDSGSAIYTDMMGMPFLVGLIYAGGGRTRYACGVPILDIMDRWPDLHLRSDDGLSYQELLLALDEGKDDYNKLLDKYDELVNTNRILKFANARMMRELSGNREFMKTLKEQIQAYKKTIK